MFLIARDQRTNRRIRAPQVRVIGANGEQLGVLPIDQALAKAQEDGLDLVEVQPMSKPPVCKIMDYGKFKYEEKKKASDAKKKQVVVHLKEVKLRPKTEEHDYEFKVRNVKRFLEEGNKARVTIMFRGREITHREQGVHILEDVIKDVKDVGVVESAPRMEGKQMYMILSPSPKVLQRVRDQVRAAALAAEKAERRTAPPSASGQGAPQGGAQTRPAEGGQGEAPAPSPAPAPAAQPTPATAGTK